MKRLVTISFAVLLLCFFVAPAMGDISISLPGRLKKPPDLPVQCHCIDPINTCNCVFVFPSPDGGGEGSLYDYLKRLPSFEREDEDYFYFRAEIVSGTQPPAFNFAVPGSARVKLSKEWVLRQG